MAGNVVAGTIEAGVAGSVAFDGNELTSLQLSGSLNRPADVGGVEVQGQVAITGNSAGLSFTVTGLFRSATVDVSGSADIQLDAAGGIRRADVQARGLIRTSDFEMGAFNGVVRIRPDQVLAMGSMTVVGPGLLLGNANGYLIDDGHNPMLVLQGQGLIQTGNRFAVADFTIVNDDIQVARLALVYPPRLVYGRAGVAEGHDQLNEGLHEPTSLGLHLPDLVRLQLRILKALRSTNFIL